MTKILLMPQTMSLLSQDSIDMLVKKGSVKMNKENIPYISIDVEEYLKIDIKTVTNESKSIQI